MDVSLISPALGLLTFLSMPCSVLSPGDVVEDVNKTYECNNSSHSTINLELLNISCHNIRLSINDKVLGDENRCTEELSDCSSKGFTVDGCQDILLQCLNHYPDRKGNQAVEETRYRFRAIPRHRNETGEGGGGYGNGIPRHRNKTGLWIGLGVSLVIVVGLLMWNYRNRFRFACCRRPRERNPMNDPPAAVSLCPSEESSSGQGETPTNPLV